MSKRVIALLAGGLAIALVAAGCGGGGSSDNGNTASISKAEFEKKGNAICTQGEERIHREATKYMEENKVQGKPSAKQFAAMAETIVVPSIKRQLDELRALGAPPGEEKQVEETFAAVEEGLEEVEKTPAKVILPESAIPAFARANKLAKGLGLHACGEEG